ncbi:hypothetical protein M2418_000429 [Rhizobium sp. BIGb0125]|nr:hypothetical protein [Rhizobium sp. BIGb0125]
MENELPLNTIAPNTPLTVEELIFRNSAQFALPASEWEKKTYQEIIALPRVTVTRPPKDQLLALDMVEYDCHTNCAAQEANDLTKSSHHVFGWMVLGSDLILHSVVKIGSQWFCLTPQLVELASRFEYIPDPLIEWCSSGDGRSREPYRSGVRLPDALRKHPERHIKMHGELLRLIASGLPVIEARDKVAATFRRPIGD